MQACLQGPAARLQWNTHVKKQPALLKVKELPSLFSCLLSNLSMWDQSIKKTKSLLVTGRVAVCGCVAVWLRCNLHKPWARGCRSPTLLAGKPLAAWLKWTVCAWRIWLASPSINAWLRLTAVVLAWVQGRCCQPECTGNMGPLASQALLWGALQQAWSWPALEQPALLLILGCTHSAQFGEGECTAASALAVSSGVPSLHLHMHHLRYHHCHCHQPYMQYLASVLWSSHTPNMRLSIQLLYARSKHCIPGWPNIL